MSYPMWRISIDDAGPVECWSVCVEGDLYTCRARLVRLEASATLGDEVEIESFAGELEAFAGRLARRLHRLRRAGLTGVRPTAGFVPYVCPTPGLAFRCS